MKSTIRELSVDTFVSQVVHVSSFLVLNNMNTVDVAEALQHKASIDFPIEQISPENFNSQTHYARDENHVNKFTFIFQWSDQRKF